jgi:uncharacterized phage protein gp47/JayE
MTEYGLTDRGFIIKPLSVILQEERDAYRASFGADIDISDESIAGAYLANHAVKIAQLWELLGGLFSVCDVDSSFSIYLDRLVAFVNVTRNAAIPTTVHEALWGDEGTLIYADHLAKLDSGEQFKLQKSVTIGKEKLLGFSCKVSDVEEGHTYSFQIDSEIISYTAVADDEEEQIQAGLIAALQVQYTQGTYTAENHGADGMLIYRTNGDIPFALSFPDTKMEIILLGAYGIYEAVKPGPIFVPIKTLVNIVSNVDGLESIINYATGITGRNTESDAELRTALSNRQRQASGNEIAIQNEIQKLPGVQYVRVYSNRTMVVTNGRPAKSFESVIVGGVDTEIAETIFNKGPAGVQAFGNTVIQVTDSEGFEWDIGFSRPVNRYVWIKIEFSKNSEEVFTVDAIEAMKDNIDEWAAKNQGVGTDLIYQKLYRPVYDVPGIATADIKVAVTSDLIPPSEEAYNSANIAIEEVEIAIIDKDRIAVEEVVI